MESLQGMAGPNLEPTPYNQPNLFAHISCPRHRRYPEDLPVRKTRTRAMIAGTSLYWACRAPGKGGDGQESAFVVKSSGRDISFRQSRIFGTKAAFIVRQCGVAEKKKERNENHPMSRLQTLPITAPVLTKTAYLRPRNHQTSLDSYVLRTLVH